MKKIDNVNNKKWKQLKISKNMLSILSSIENDKIHMNCKLQVYTVINFLITTK